MNSAQPQQEVLLSINLAVATENRAKIVPIITECGGHEIGSSSQTYFAGFAATEEGVNLAVSCAQRIQVTVPQGTPVAMAIHLGDIRAEGMTTLMAMRKVTRAGGITVSQAIIGLGGTGIPIALEPLETSQGPTPFYTTARTRFIDVQPTSPGASSERTNTKIIYATNAAANLKVRRAASDEDSKWSRMSGLIEQFGFKGVVAIVILVAILNINTTQALFERGKNYILQGSVARAVVEKSAKLDAEIKKTGEMLVQPIALAKKAAAQASEVSPELLALAPEIRAEDVAGKPRAPNAAPATATVAATPNAAAAQVQQAPAENAPPTPVQNREIAAVPSPNGAATPPSASTGASPIVEDALLSKCANDAEFCHSTGLVFLKENSFSSALPFFERACQMGLAKSCIQASTLYQNGQGVERSELLAKTFLAKACAKNSGTACTEVGLAYLQGTGLPISPAKAREAIDRGCALGHGPACLLLGLAVQAPPEGVARSKASSADSLARGCELMKISSCVVPQGGLQQPAKPTMAVPNQAAK